ncbi:DUF2125 domain-containing protein [Pseudaestuariivita rosea]|uniref:DUF2125 domain-containing protein n=1 Tax=Pseudaestuariivita rosea TaxID=2763263 RepID=UPI001ABB4A86|nr:DUF2125 domain-containing protein [Pseudaestuariivita rosea]
MTHISKSALSAAAILLSTTAISADITADQVWEDWQKSLVQYGDTIDTGSADRTGDTLRVTGVSATTTDDQTEMLIRFPDMSLREMGDGTVSVTMDTDYIITFTDNSPFSEFDEMRMSVGQQAFLMTVSGSPEEMNYDLSADSMTFSIDEIRDGEDVFELIADFTLNDISGTYLVTPGGTRRVEQDVTAETAVIDVDIQDPQGSGRFIVDGTINNLVMDGLSNMPDDLDMADPNSLFADNVTINGGYRFDDANYTFSFEEGSDTASGSMTSGGGQMSLEMGGNTMRYEGEAQDLAVNVQSSELPIPVELDMASYGYAFEMPVAQTEEPADFELGLSFSEFSMSDLLWNMFDPGEALPRDPATVAFDLTGTMSWLFDIMDPEQSQEMMMAETPVELYEVNLNNLLVQAVGARLTGDGAFTFDNTDLETFDGMPRPLGSINFNLEGANGLLDTLVSMGLLPEDQAMGARMMMGMFAVPGEGEDTLTSTVEVNDEGHVLANGQRLR